MYKKTGTSSPIPINRPPHTCILCIQYVLLLSSIFLCNYCYWLCKAICTTCCASVPSHIHHNIPINKYTRTSSSMILIIKLHAHDNVDLVHFPNTSTKITLDDVHVDDDVCSCLSMVNNFSVFFFWVVLPIIYVENMWKDTCHGSSTKIWLRMFYTVLCNKYYIMCRFYSYHLINDIVFHWCYVIELMYHIIIFIAIACYQQ